MDGRPIIAFALLLVPISYLYFFYSFVHIKCFTSFFFLIYQWIGEGGVGREKSEEAAGKQEVAVAQVRES